MTTWELRCYGEPFGQRLSLQVAMAVMVDHIHACPHGAMPWAEPVEWYGPEDGVWVTAANGEWLNHHVAEIGKSE